MMKFVKTPMDIKLLDFGFQCNYPALRDECSIQILVRYDMTYSFTLHLEYKFLYKYFKNTPIYKKKRKVPLYFRV